MKTIDGIVIKKAQFWTFFFITMIWPHLLIYTGYYKPPNQWSHFLSKLMYTSRPTVELSTEVVNHTYKLSKFSCKANP